MKVSVIVAAYNIEKYIGKCLESIVNQTLNKIEIIVVNDGSTDSTLDNIKDIANIDNRIIIVNKDNEGLVEARKSGLEIAKGEYILFVDGDDWLELKALEILYSKGTSDNYDIVLYNSYLCYEYRKEKSNTFKSSMDVINNPLKSLLMEDILPSICLKLVKKEFLSRNNIDFPSNISFAEDLATVTNWFINKPKIGKIENNLYNYFQRDDSITKKVSPKILEVNTAINFVEEKIRKSNLYEKYEKEFEYMVFKHLFYYRILNKDKLELIHKQVYKQFKSRKINIYNNKYIINSINENPISYRVRVRLYNTNYNLGKYYDICRENIKLLLNIN